MSNDRWRELLESPFDADERSRRTGTWRWIVAAALVVALAVGGGAWLFLGGADDPAAPPATNAGPVAPGPSEAPTTTVLGEVGYPPSVLSAVMAYVPDTARIVMFGGWDRRGVQDGTWVLDLVAGQWRDVSPLPSPPGRVAGAHAFDTKRSRLLVYGGATERLRFCSPIPRCSPHAVGDTWWYDPAANEWTEVSAPGPSPRVGAAMAYDAAGDRFVLFGGGEFLASQQGNAFGDTWVFDPDGETWERLDPAVSPPDRVFATMGYDADSERVLLWGGATPGEDDDGLWAFAGDEWAQVPDGEAPPPRYLHALVPVPDRGEMLLLGGIGVFTTELGAGITTTESRATDEVWVLDPGARAWSAGEPAVWPLQDLSAAYHAELGQVVVFAGGPTYLVDPVTGAWDDRSEDLGAIADE